MLAESYYVNVTHGLYFYRIVKIMKDFMKCIKVYLLPTVIIQFYKRMLNILKALSNRKVK